MFEFFIGEPMTLSVPYAPSWQEISGMDTKLPIELHMIIGTYVGNITYRRDHGHGPQWAFSNSRACIERTAPSKLSVTRGRSVLRFDANAWDIFENHIVVADGGWVFIIDTDHFKELYPPHRIQTGHLRCGPTSFKLGETYYSYSDVPRPIYDDWCEYDWGKVMNIEDKHYVETDHNSPLYREIIEMPQCDLCNCTCMTIMGQRFAGRCLHFRLTPVGKCGIRVHRTGTRTTVVLSGPSIGGMRFIIYDIADKARGRTDLTLDSILLDGYDNNRMFPDDALILFAGDGISIADVNGDWHSYGVEE